MKPYFTILALLASSVLAQASSFFLTDLKAAERTSAQTGKPIFLDAFTTWCAPCKQMDLEVFSRPEVQEMLQRDFVPLRLDMEREQGLELVQRFGISSYPTLLVFDNRGELHRAVGFQSVQKLQAFAKTSVDSKANYRHLQKRFKSGERELSFLTQIQAYAKASSLPQREEYAYAYLLSSGEWTNEEASLLLLESPQSTASPLFDSLVSRRDQVAAAYGAPQVDERIARLVDEALFGAAPAKPRQAKKIIARAYPAQVDSTYLRYCMRRAREAGKAKQFGKFAIKSQAKYPSNSPDELEELIYVFEQKLPGWREDQVEEWRQRARSL